MLERIKEIVAESLGTEAGTLTESTSFKEDLGADSCSHIGYQWFEKPVFTGFSGIDPG